MVPWLCLYHWDLPPGAWRRFCGWTNRDTAFWFADYAAVVAKRTADRVKHYITFNESSVFTVFWLFQRLGGAGRDRPRRASQGHPSCEPPPRPRRRRAAEPVGPMR